MLKYTILFFIVILVCITQGVAQKSKAQLQKEKKINIQKIKEAQATLDKTSAQKKVSIGQLSALKYQINAQANLIANYKSEINLLTNEIEQDQQIIESLEQDVAHLKKEYAAMIYAAYKANKGQDKLTFLFSASSFNQFFRRLQYLDQYAEARKKQVAQINAVKEQLTKQLENIQLKKTEQQALLKKQLVEKENLEKLKAKELNVITSLNGREKELKKEIAKRNKSLATLNKLIDNLIKKELEAEKLAKSKALTNNSKLMAADFSKNKTKLPWPITGFISQHFGISKDPILKGVEHNNPGIEIQTKPNSIARCISPGKVSKIFLVQGFNKGILVNHGSYYTVYAKLSTVSVKKGQQLKVGDPVGTVYTGTDGIAELHFEIWKSFTKLNPEKWLVHK